MLLLLLLLFAIILPQGFNCRLFARDLDKAEKLFGPDGATVDIVIGDVRVSLI